MATAADTGSVTQVPPITYSLKNKEQCCQLVPKLIDKIDTLDEEEIVGYEKLI